MEYVVLFKKPERTLSDEVSERKSKNIPFSEEEAELIVENAIQGLDYLKAHKNSHGNINASNILINDRR